MGYEHFLQMVKVIAPVVVFGISINQIRMVSAVQTDFIIYFLFIPGQLFFRISAVPAIFRNTEMFDIHRLVSLGNRKIRSIGFVRIPHIIRINLLVHIVDAVHEQEIRYPDLLNRP